MVFILKNRIRAATGMKEKEKKITEGKEKIERKTHKGNPCLSRILNKGTERNKDKAWQLTK